LTKATPRAGLLAEILIKVIHSSFALSYGGRFAEKCLDFSKANYFSLGWFVKNATGFIKAL
jgi:hypothetical protein